MSLSEPRFDERFLAEAFAALETTETQAADRDPLQYDLEYHAQNITRSKCIDECEDAIADLSPNLANYLLGVFDQITDSFLPAPIWQAPQTPAKKGKQKHHDVVLQSLRIVSAARLALASHGSSDDKELKAKVNKLYLAAARYLDSIPHFESLQDIEALLLLAELEYGYNHDGAAKVRLKSVIFSLTESMRMRSTLIFGQSLTLIRRRNALRTALMMLHWYFGEVPGPLEDLTSEADLEPDEVITNAEELFVTAQLRLASHHHKLKKFLDAQAFVDEKTWSLCEKSFTAWYESQRARSKELDCAADDAPVNYFVFHQQYLTTRIMLSRSHKRLYKRRSGVRSPEIPQETWTCPTSAKHDAIKIASSLRNYGQRHRFREAPLSFVGHISASADIVINSAENAANEDDRNAYLHISSFLCGVLKYMAEVHVRAGALLEAVQQRMNNVIQENRGRPGSSSIGWGDRGSLYSQDDSHLWQWTRYDLTEDFTNVPTTSEAERPKSVIGGLELPESRGVGKRPQMVRQASTPARLAGGSVVSQHVSIENLQAATPSFHTTKDAASDTTAGPQPIPTNLSTLSVTSK